MRLSLHTLLAFEDNVFDFDRQRQLERTIPLYEPATRALARIRSVVRNPRLGVPGKIDQHEELDPNLVAEYLDHQMSSEYLEQFETFCFSSDKYLAEVASVHQVISNVLGEPARINRECRLRCYALQQIGIEPEKPVLTFGYVEQPPLSTRPDLATEQTEESASQSKSKLWILLLLIALLGVALLAWNLYQKRQVQPTSETKVVFSEPQKPIPMPVAQTKAEPRPEPIAPIPPVPVVQAKAEPKYEPVTPAPPALVVQTKAEPRPEPIAPAPPAPIVQAKAEPKHEPVTPAPPAPVVQAKVEPKPEPVAPAPPAPIIQAKVEPKPEPVAPPTPPASVIQAKVEPKPVKEPLDPFMIETPETTTSIAEDPFKSQVQPARWESFSSQQVAKEPLDIKKVDLPPISNNTNPLRETSPAPPVAWKPFQESRIHSPFSLATAEQSEVVPGPTQENPPQLVQTESLDRRSEKAAPMPPALNAVNRERSEVSFLPMSRTREQTEKSETPLSEGDKEPQRRPVFQEAAAEKQHENRYNVVKSSEIIPVGGITEQPVRPKPFESGRPCFGRLLRSEEPCVVFTAISASAPWRLLEDSLELQPEQYLLTAAPFRADLELHGHFQVEMIGDTKLCVLPPDPQGIPGIFLDYGRLVIHMNQASKGSHRLRIRTEKTEGVVTINGHRGLVFVDTFAEIVETTPSSPPGSPSNRSGLSSQTSAILGLLPDPDESLAWTTEGDETPFVTNQETSILLAEGRSDRGTIRNHPNWIRRVSLPPESRAIEADCRRIFKENGGNCETALHALIRESSTPTRSFGLRLWGDLGRFDIPLSILSRSEEQENPVKTMLVSYFREVMKRDEESVQRLADAIDSVRR